MVNTKQQFVLFFGLIIISAFLFFAGGSSPFLMNSEGTSENELSEFFYSQSEEAYFQSVDAWPTCIEKSNQNLVACNTWHEGDLHFELVGILVENVAPVPVIVSRDTSYSISDRIVIHLTGGPDLPPFATWPDPRREAFNFFHDRGYLVASIAYWGTSFRTKFEDGEVLDAVADFEQVYEYYSRECDCAPLVVGESLGAAVLFNRSSSSAVPRERLLAIAPVMGGIDEAIAYYKEAMTNSELNINARRSRVYKAGEPLGYRLINSLEHLKKFSHKQNTSPSHLLLEGECPIFIVGRNDPLNGNFHKWDYSSVWEIDGAGHDLFSNHTNQLKAAFSAALECQNNNLQKL